MKLDNACFSLVACVALFLGTLGSSAAAQSWTSTGTMNAARTSATATRLSDGRVLVAGGYDIVAGSFLSSAEIYDPAAGTWTLTSPMVQPQGGAIAVLLNDGRVLVYGGSVAGGASGVTNSAQIFDPTTGQWTATGSMNQCRQNLMGTLLANGQALAVGGYCFGYLDSAETYDPSTGTWSVTGSLPVAVANASATLLPNGNVLVAGGTNGSAVTAAELYDPSARIWSSTGSMNQARTWGGNGTILLNSGKVLAVGGLGGSGCGSILGSAELYDPAAGTWASTGGMSTERVNDELVLLNNGQVLATGGQTNANSCTTWLNTAEMYDPASGTWTSTAPMNEARGNHAAATLSDGRVLVAGGQNASMSLDSTEIFGTGDTIPPSLTLPAAITAEATGPNGAVVNYNVTATDNVDGTDPVICTPASGSTFPVGTTTVACSSTDKAGNTATGAFTVTVRDTAPPTLSLPGNMTVNATAALTPVTFTATAADLVDGTDSVSCSPASGSGFALGTTTVTCSASDKSGNTASGQFTITVKDVTPPVLSLPANITVNGTATLTPVTFTATATDNVDGSVSVTCNPASGSGFPIGITTVHCQASDKSGNTASGQFTITVKDVTPPVLSLPANITVNGTATLTQVTFTATATDNVDGSVPVTCNPASGSAFPVGITTVHCQASDKSGNTASGQFTVTVLGADLAISQTAVSGGPGKLFTITVVNNGPITATGVVVTDSVPGPFVFASMSANCFSVGTSSTTVQCSLGSLAKGGAATLTLGVKSKPTDVVTNTVSVSATTPDPNTTNNTSTLSK